jgi:peroxiredoxin
MHMSTEQATPTLADQLASYTAGLATQAPPEIVATFDREIESLVRSGIAAHALKQGAQAPDFTLPNVDGRPVTLSALLKQGPVVLTFYRGDWCPYCNLQLRAYQHILPQIQELGASLVAVSPQTPDNSLTTAEKKGLAFPVLSDTGNATARRYGLVFTLGEAVRQVLTQSGSHVPTFNGDDSWELPMPGTFVLAPDGTVRLAFVDADWTRRLEPAAILDTVRRLAIR